MAGVSWTSASAVVVSVVQLLRIAFLTDYLEKSDFGVVAIVLFVLGITDLFMELGITVAILHRKQISREEYSSLYWLNWVLSLVLFGVLYALSPLIAGFYEAPELRQLIPLMGLTLIVTALGRQHKTVFRKHLYFNITARFEMAAALLSLVPAYYLAKAGWGVYALVFSYLAGYAVENVLVFVYGLTTYPLRFHFRFAETRPFLRIGLYDFGSRLLSYFNRDIDLLIIGKLLGQEVLGGYSLMKQLASKPLNVINPIITSVTSPVLSQLQDDEAAMKRVYLKTLNALSIVNFPVFIGIGLLCQPLVRLIFGEEYLEVAFLVPVFAFYYLIRSVSNPVGSLLIAKGKTNYGLYWNLVVGATFPIAVILASLFSVEVVAGVQLFMMLIYYFAMWYVLVRRLSPIGLREYLKQSSGPMLYAFISSGAGVGVLILTSHMHYLFQLVAGGFVFAAVYAVQIWYLYRQQITDIFPFLARWKT